MNEGELENDAVPLRGERASQETTAHEPRDATRSMSRRGQLVRAWVGAAVVGSVSTIATIAISVHMNAQADDAPEQLPDGTFVGLPIGIGVFLCVGLIAARRYWLGFTLGPVAGFMVGGFFMGLSFLGPVGPLVVPFFAVWWGFSSGALPIAFAAALATGFLLLLRRTRLQ